MQDDGNVTHAIDIQLATNLCDDYNKKMIVLSILNSLRALQELANEKEIAIEQIGRKLIFKEFAGIVVTDDDIQRAREKVEKDYSYHLHMKDHESDT